MKTRAAEWEEQRKLEDRLNAQWEKQQRQEAEMEAKKMAQKIARKILANGRSSNLLTSC